MSEHGSATERADDHRGAGFGHHLEPGASPALVLVDPVRAYVDPECPLYLRGESAVGGMRTLLTHARAAGIPVVITRVLYRPDGRDGGVFFRKVPALAAFVEGSAYGEIAAGLEPGPDDLVVVKKYPSAFFGTTLAATLTGWGVDTVILAGFSVSGCVRASALDAMQHGFVPVVVSDAVADRDPAIVESNLFDIGHKIAEVWTTDQVGAHLARPGVSRTGGPRSGSA